MKNILLSAAFLLLIGKLSAQHSEFALTVGTIGSKLTSDSVDFDREIGFQFGLTADFYLMDNFSLRSGLILNQKRSKYGSNLLLDEFGNILDTLSEVRFNEKTSIGIQIPVLAHYHFNSQIGLYFGPSIELINGLVDYGINAGMTVKVKRVEITLNYNQNFNDVSVWPELGENKYTSFSMSLGYYFKQ